MSEEQIKSVASEVYEQLGSGYSEAVYNKGMQTELRLRGIHYEYEKIIPIDYKGVTVGHSRADLVVGNGDNRVVVELKCLSSSLAPQHKQQLRTYLSQLNLTKGLLINFPLVRGTQEIIEVGLN